MRQSSRIIAQKRIFDVDNCGLMAGGRRRSGMGPRASAEFPTGVKEVVTLLGQSPSQRTAWHDKGYGASWAKCHGFRRRSPQGSPRGQAITRTTFIAVALNSCGRCVRANPRYGFVTLWPASGITGRAAGIPGAVVAGAVSAGPPRRAHAARTPHRAEPVEAAQQVDSAFVPQTL
jgi:hypothetical protein